MPLHPADAGSVRMTICVSFPTDLKPPSALQVILFYSVAYGILIGVKDRVAMQTVADHNTERAYRTVFYAQVGWWACAESCGRAGAQGRVSTGGF